jgi:hypothetical protein
MQRVIGAAASGVGEMREPAVHQWFN